MVKKPEFHVETSLIRKIFERQGIDVSVWKHAKEELANDGLNLLDVYCALKGCWVTNVEAAGILKWRYTVQGINADGVKMTIVLEADDLETLDTNSGNIKISVVTVWKVK